MNWLFVSRPAAPAVLGKGTFGCWLSAVRACNEARIRSVDVCPVVIDSSVTIANYLASATVHLAESAGVTTARLVALVFDVFEVRVRPRAHVDPHLVLRVPLEADRDHGVAAVCVATTTGDDGNSPVSYTHLTTTVNEPKARNTTPRSSASPGAEPTSSTQCFATTRPTSPKRHKRLDERHRDTPQSLTALLWRPDEESTLESEDSMKGERQ